MSTAPSSARVIVLGIRQPTFDQLAAELGGGFQVHAATSAPEALAELARDPSIAAVVTELALAELGIDDRGLDVLRAAAVAAAGCARILLTSRQCVVLDHDASSLVDAVFGVPWRPGAIRTFLGQRAPR